MKYVKIYVKIYVKCMKMLNSIIKEKNKINKNKK